MKPSARITVTTGPDRGKLFELTDELVHVGKGADNEVVLADPTLGDHQVSIIRRNGRHAIFAVQASEVTVDGTPLPHERWVWLPENAQIQLNKRTILEFTSLLEADAVETVTASEMEATVIRPRDLESPSSGGTNAPGTGRGAEATTVRRPRVKRAEAKRPEKPAANVARFITDQPGDPLVKLGEDGHLPELMLAEGQEQAQPSQQRSQHSNPLVLIGAFVFSIGLSVLMLFVDPQSLGGAGEQKALARQLVTAFYGGDGTPLEPYEIALRQAQQAHAKGNYGLERRKYRDVLMMLRAENKNPITGLTSLDGDQERQLNRLTFNDLRLVGDDFLQLKNDEKLERLLSILLAE